MVVVVVVVVSGRLVPFRKVNVSIKYKSREEDGCNNPQTLVAGTTINSPEGIK